MPKKVIKRKRIKKLKKSINYFQIVLGIFTLVIFLLVAFYFLILNNSALSIFPLLHRYQSSPANYVHEKSILNNTPKPGVILHGSRGKKEIAITFDADMTYGMINLLNKGVVKSWYNKPVIDYLNKENVKATIFLTGLWVKTYPKKAKEIAQNPLFEIGNHSYSHPAFTVNCFHLPFISDAKDKDEVASAQEEIIKETKVVPLLFRFPGGCYDKIDLNIVSKLGLTIVHWDVVAGDGFNNNTQSIINNVERNTQNGSIIVMHLNDGTYAPKTYYALLQIIPDLKKRGFTFVKVSDLIGKNN